MTLSQLAAIADSTRSRLALALEAQELAVSELAVALQLPQSSVSRHLKVLSDEGWVTSRADGTSRYYRLAHEEAGPRQRLWAAVREEIAGGEQAAQDLAGVQSVLAERRRRSREFFSSQSGHWDAMREELFGGADIPLFATMLDPRAVVADLGCGTGRLSRWIAPYVRQLYAVDGSDEMLRTAQEHLAAYTNVQLQHAELERLPLASDSVDLALLSLVLPYSSDPARVLAEAARILVPGGRLVLLDLQPHERSDLREQLGQLWPGFSEEQLRAWLGALNITDIHYQPIAADPLNRGPRLFTLSARRSKP